MRIGIIGAGIAGLTCAYELHKAGHEVEVFEKEAVVGGRMSTRQVGDYPMDIGANHLANVYTHMREYVEELGLDWQPMDFLNYRMYKHGGITGLLDSLSKKTQRRLVWRSLLDIHKRVDFFDFNTCAHLDTDTAEEYTRTKLTDEAYDYLIDPFVSVYQFHRANEISTGVVYGMMRSHYTKKRDWDLHHIAGGMIALPQALAKNVTVHLSTPVEKITPVDGGVELSVQGETKTYDAVVSAATASVTNHLFPTASAGQKKVLEGTRYAATIGLAFEVPKETLGDTTIVWVPYAVSKTISGYTNEAMKGEALVKNGKTLLITWFHEEFTRDVLFNKSDEEIYEIAKVELMKVCPYVTDPSILTPYDLQHWPEAMPVFRKGHLKMVKEFLDNHQGEQRVYFAGDYLNAPWTEGALRQGQRTAKRIIEELGGRI